jgi:hypothetical protein
MSSGAYALYVDAQAGGGPNPPIDRIVPLPHGSREIQFDRRRLTLSCDNPQPTALPSLVGTGRFPRPVPSSMSQSTLGNARS